MSDVEIVFPQGREAVVRRLREALAEAGYDVGGRAVGEGDGTSAASDAAAILILWDRSTMAHPALQAAASAARNRDRAIDVSVDGITPLGLDDDRNLVQLSGWRGDPHHPGWRKILQRLDRLCRPRREAVPARPAASAPAAARAAGDEAAASRGPWKMWAATAIVLLLIVVVAGVLTARRGASPGPGAPPADAARQPAPADVAPPPSSAAPAQPMAAAGAEASGAPDAASPAPQPQSAPASHGPAAVPAALSGAGRPEQAASAAPAPSKGRARSARAGPRPRVRYTHYSRNMRLFCERAGRRTHECRVFNAATRS
ncbi:MAG TPA: hypothetical protein VGF77_05930 [Allosphingosinicella sp.]